MRLPAIVLRLVIFLRRIFSKSISIELFLRLGRMLSSSEMREACWSRFDKSRWNAKPFAGLSEITLMPPDIGYPAVSGAGK